MYPGSPARLYIRTGVCLHLSTRGPAVPIPAPGPWVRRFGCADFGVQLQPRGPLGLLCPGAGSSPSPEHAVSISPASCPNLPCRTNRCLELIYVPSLPAACWGGQRWAVAPWGGCSSSRERISVLQTAPCTAPGTTGEIRGPKCFQHPCPSGVRVCFIRPRERFMLGQPCLASSTCFPPRGGGGPRVLVGAPGPGRVLRAPRGCHGYWSSRATGCASR